MAIGAIVLIAGVLGIRCSSWMLGVLWYPLQLLWYPLQILVAAVISLVAAAGGAMVSGRRCQDHDQRAAIPEAVSAWYAEYDDCGAFPGCKGGCTRRPKTFAHTKMRFQRL